MKKVSSLIISLLLLPTVTFAAFNDVTLTTSTVIQIGSYALNVTGSSAVLESMTVNAGNFSVTMLSGSSITVTSPTKNQLQTNTALGVTNTCTGTVSSVAISGTAGTITITPTATICADGAPDPDPTPEPVHSGGGASGSRARSTIPAPVINPNIPVPGPIASTTPFFFSRTLTVGQTGLDVKALQQYLNAKGFTVALAGPGSKGNETTMFGGLTRAALARFQAANKIYPSVGFFGPITKAFINSHL